MKISIFQLVSVAEQAGLNLTWLETLHDDRFSRVKVHMTISYTHDKDI